MRYVDRLAFVIMLALYVLFLQPCCAAPEVPTGPGSSEKSWDGAEERERAVRTQAQPAVPPPAASAMSKPKTFPLETPLPGVAAECRAAILIYHHIDPHQPGENADTRAMTVSPAALDRQLRYLSEHGYAVVPYGDVVDCVTRRTPLPPHAVVITFDDGWASQYRNALPLLEKYGMTATFFVVTDYVTERSGGGILSWEQIRALDAKGMTIASHSRTHPFLSKIWDAGRLRYEVAGSKKVLEDHLHKPALFFAYPFGSYDRRTVEAVKAAKYAAARGTYDGTRHQPSDLFVMKGIYVTDSLDRFARDIER